MPRAPAAWGLTTATPAPRRPAKDATSATVVDVINRMACCWNAEVVGSATAGHNKYGTQVIGGYSQIAQDIVSPVPTCCGKQRFDRLHVPADVATPTNTGSIIQPQVLEAN